MPLNSNSLSPKTVPQVHHPLHGVVARHRGGNNRMTLCHGGWRKSCSTKLGFRELQFLEGKLCIRLSQISFVQRIMVATDSLAPCLYLYRDCSVVCIAKVLSPLHTLTSEVDEVIETHLRNAENACESNSFYLDMYVDESCSSPVPARACHVPPKLQTD